MFCKQNDQLIFEDFKYANYRERENKIMGILFRSWEACRLTLYVKKAVANTKHYKFKGEMLIILHFFVFIFLFSRDQMHKVYNYV